MMTIAGGPDDAARFSRPNADHAPGEVVTCGCDLGLADMPPELLVCIAEKLDRPRDLVAAQIASSLFAHVPLGPFVGRRCAGRLRALIEAGAPVGAVRVAIAHNHQTLSANLIRPAVRYGDVSVLDVLCRTLLDVRISPYFLIAFFFPSSSLCPFVFFSVRSPERPNPFSVVISLALWRARLVFSRSLCIF